MTVNITLTTRSRASCEKEMYIVKKIITGEFADQGSTKYLEIYQSQLQQTTHFVACFFTLVSKPFNLQQTKISNFAAFSKIPNTVSHFSYAPLIKCIITRKIYVIFLF